MRGVVFFGVQVLPKQLPVSWSWSYNIMYQAYEYVGLGPSGVVPTYQLPVASMFRQDSLYLASCSSSASGD